MKYIKLDNQSIKSTNTATISKFASYINHMLDYPREIVLDATNHRKREYIRIPNSMLDNSYLSDYNRRVDSSNDFILKREADSEALPIKAEIQFKIVENDEYGSHFHSFKGYAHGNIITENGHMHYMEGETTVSKGHKHRFRLYTLPVIPVKEDFE